MHWMKGDMVDVARKERAWGLGFTANAVLTKDGRLVMGAGAAKRVATAFPGCDAALGKAVQVVTGQPHAGFGVQPDYFLASVEQDGLVVCAIQTKRHFQDHLNNDAKASCWDLTLESLKEVRAFVGSEPRHSPFVMNCPLIHHGGFQAHEHEVGRMVEHILGVCNIIVTKL